MNFQKEGGVREVTTSRSPQRPVPTQLIRSANLGGVDSCFLQADAPGVHIFVTAATLMWEANCNLPNLALLPLFGKSVEKLE